MPNLNGASLELEGMTANSDGYVYLEDGDTYKLDLGNNRAVDCDVELSIDGKEVGMFRVGRYSSVTIERPPNDNGQFTFYSEKSSTGKKLLKASHVNPSDRGLIQAVFKFSKPYFEPPKVVKPYVRPLDRDTQPWRRRSDEWWDQYPQPKPRLGAKATRTYGGGPSGQSIRSAGVQMMGYNYNQAPQASAGVTGLSGHSDQSFIEVPNLKYDTKLTTTLFIRLLALKPAQAVRPLMPNTGKYPRPI